MKLPAIIVLALYLTAPSVVHCQLSEQREIVVAQDGSGEFMEIQAALNSVPADNSTSTIILIKNGVYNEKLFITKSHVVLVGEHRDSTRIVYAELREHWTKASNTRTIEAAQHDDWGAAVVNIGDGVTDLTLANLTVYNNYGSLHGNNAHQFAIRGFNATRIALLYCMVRADGGDTVSLWNPNGMYYHSNCSFEGWVDYVCPRGWCYITDSKFFGHNLSASIWHDGSANKNQRLVIRNSSFDGTPGFPLGRHHRDAQLYLLDCTFSENMADRPIYSPKSPNIKPWVWGTRHYYDNCRRDAGEYSWFANNLEEAEGSPTQNDISAAWTFDGTWNPEETLPSVLPFAAIPKPRNRAYDVISTGITLKWIEGRDAIEHRVFFSEETPPRFVASQKEASFTTGRLRSATTYYWKVDEVTTQGVVEGEVWSFTTSHTL